MVCCFATELPCVERGHAVEILLFEEVGLEPVDTAFMAACCQCAIIGICCWTTHALRK
jgi:hypothetical protein